VESVETGDAPPVSPLLTLLPSSAKTAQKLTIKPLTKSASFSAKYGRQPSYDNFL
jgi:hypothetical protein